MSQFQEVLDVLNINFPNVSFNVSQQNNEIIVVWEGLPTECDVFSKVMPLSNIFNYQNSGDFTSIENEKYTSKITISNKVAKDETDRLFHELLTVLRTDDRLSVKLINRKISERNPDLMEIFKIKTKTIQLRHLLDNNFTNYNVRITSVDVALNNALNIISQEVNQEVLDFLTEYSMQEDFKNALNKVRNLYSNMYFTNSIQEFTLELLKRKIKDSKHLFVEDFQEINNNVIKKFIKRSNHSGEIEKLLSDITTEQLTEPLFNISKDSGNYEELLTKHINLFLNGDKLSPIEQEIYTNTPSNQKQTIHTLSGFQGFLKKNFNGNEYLEKNVSGVKKLILTDSLIIICVNDKIASKVTNSIQEKIKILTSL
ncbi:hypothetical protein [Sutterella wadsworthensis]|uniref:hypothetical protein n=1 Tax=Sutterella wadsworthensis TaxID=40545 RepID=UPI0032C1DC07